RYVRTQGKNMRVHRQSNLSAKTIARSLGLCVKYKIHNRVRRWFISEEQSQRSAFNDALRCRLIVNLGSNMRSRREPERGTVRQFDEPVPWRPASNPLPGFLNREKCGADNPAIAWHVFHCSDATLRGEAQIDDVVLNLFTLPGLDGFRA